MSLATDISTITTIPISSVEKFIEKEELCILHAVSENEHDGNTITVADIGIGSLYIKHDGNELKYKFIPSKPFEYHLKETILTGTSPLINKVENALKEKITGAYKDLF